MTKKILDQWKTWDPSENTDAFKKRLWQKIKKKMEENGCEAELEDEALDQAAGGRSLSFEDEKKIF